MYIAIVNSLRYNPAMGETYINKEYDANLLTLGSFSIRNKITKLNVTNFNYKELLVSFGKALILGKKVRPLIPEFKNLSWNKIDNFYEKDKLKKYKLGNYPLVNKDRPIDSLGRLKAITADEVYNTHGYRTDILFHQGLISNLDVESEKVQPAKLTTFNNIHNLIEKGVFGSPIPTQLTYLRPSDSLASGMSRSALIVILKIDLKLFPKEWPIYHNIEMWKDWGAEKRPNWATYDIPCASYGIPGGIPAVCISHVTLARVERYE